MKQERYTSQTGKDLIDRWAEEKSVEEFRAIMIAQIEKYCARYGKKDNVISEVRKIVDYGQRLLDYEMNRGGD